MKSRHGSWLRHLFFSGFTSSPWKYSILLSHPFWGNINDIPKRSPLKYRGKITHFWNITIYFHRFSIDFLGFPVSHRFSIDFSYVPINFHRFSYSFPLKIHLKTSRHLATTAAPSSAPHGLGRRTFLSTGKCGGEDVAENGWTTTSYVWVIWVIWVIWVMNYMNYMNYPHIPT